VPIEPLSPQAAKAFGRRLAEARRRQGLTQEKLADEVNLSREHISRLERGLSNESRGSSADPTLTVLLELSRGLGMQLRIDQVRNGEIIIEFVEPGLG
jgi:transcriptional regulator with XRE-family HTH domain